MSAAVFAVKSKDSVIAPEIGHPEQTDVAFVTGRLHRNIRRRFSSLGGCPNNVGRFHGSVWQVENTGQLLNIQDIAVVNKKTGLIFQLLVTVKTLIFNFK